MGASHARLRSSEFSKSYYIDPPLSLHMDLHMFNTFSACFYAIP